MFYIYDNGILVEKIIGADVDAVEQKLGHLVRNNNNVSVDEKQQYYTGGNEDGYGMVSQSSGYNKGPRLNGNYLRTHKEELGSVHEHPMNSQGTPYNTDNNYNQPHQGMVQQSSYNNQPQNFNPKQHQKSYHS